MQFEPSIMVFEIDPIDKWLRGNSFAFIDIVDTLGVMHMPIFDQYGIKLKIKTIMTNREFTHNNRQVTIIFARSKSDIKTVRKAVKDIYKAICSEERELIDLYQRAHEEGFFADLHGLRL